FGDGNGRAGYRPRTQGRIELCGEIQGSEREAQPQPRQTEELPEGPQYDDVAAGYFARQACLRRPGIHECFVDGEKATPAAQTVRQCQPPPIWDDTAIP